MLFRTSVLVALLGCSALMLGCRDLGVSDTLPPSARNTQNINPDDLDELVARIAGGAHGQIHSLLIMRNDSMVVEEYFQGYTRTQKERVYSVTKSVTSALIGIALEEDAIQSIHDPMLDYYATYEAAENPAPLKSDITIENLLNMTAGFRWNETTTSYTEPANDANRMALDVDWIHYMLSLPMENDPGDHFVYNSGCTVLLSGILREATGENADSYAAKKLFNKIGISDWSWDRSPLGLINTGWGLHLRPSGMLLFGRLYLQYGYWSELEVVPESWVLQSTDKHVSAGFIYDYGYQWWRFDDSNTIAQKVEKNDIFFAWGWGGQFIFVIPHLNMVVVTTAGNFADSAPAFTILGTVLDAVEG